MSIEVRVPNLPESVADATLVSWHKQPGDPVSQGENLIDLETDKVVLELPAPADGVMGEIVRGDGETVTTNDLLATIEESSGAVAQAAQAPAGDSAPAAVAAEAPALSPAVRRLVEEHSLDADQITGTGRGGRIIKSDVLEHIESKGAATAQVAHAPAVAPANAPSPAPAVSAPAGSRVEQRVPMTRLRARIAERLLQAQQTAAILTTFNEVNMQPVMELRSRYKEKFEKQHDVRLGFMSFFVKASVEALKRYPAVNASIDGSDVVYHAYHDIGIAVSSPRGLVVPILRDADDMSFAGVEQTIADYAGKARDGSLSLDDITGGTFSITNGGVFGSLLSTPILNPPQSAILGMHKTMDRAMVENGQVIVRPMMYLALSYDHRIVDGKEAVSFLVAIKECLEDPARLLLQV